MRYGLSFSLGQLHQTERFKYLFIYTDTHIYTHRFEFEFPWLIMRLNTICLFPIWVSFVTCLFRSFTCFALGLSLWIHGSSLYSLDMGPLLFIFFYLDCFITFFFKVVLWIEVLIFLTKSNLSICFSFLVGAFCILFKKSFLVPRLCKYSPIYMIKALSFAFPIYIFNPPLTGFSV